MQTYTKPRQGTSSELLNFLLQMSSLEERKEYRKMQEGYAKMAKEQLGMAREVHEAEMPLRKEDAVTARGRMGIKEGLLLTDKKIREAQRKYDVAKASGNTATQAVAARALKVLKDSRRDAPILMEWAFFAEEKGKEQTAENQLLRQQVFSASQETKAIMRMMDLYKMQTDAKLDMVRNTSKMATELGVHLTGEAVDAALAGQSATEISKILAPGIAAEAGEGLEKARTGKWIDPADFTELERKKFDPWSLAEYSDAFRNTGRGVETMTVPRPKDQRRFFWKDENELTLTKKGAMRIGALDLWNAAKTKADNMVQPRSTGTMPYGRWGAMPAKKKTVKELADEKAKKVTPAGGKAAKKPAGKETRGGYTVGQIIEAGGRRWKVTGFDTDGEPLVTEVK